MSSSSSEPRFPFLQVDSPPGYADELAYALLEMGATGVEHRDDQTVIRGPGGGVVRLIASFATREGADTAAAGLEQACPEDAGVSWLVDELVGDGWRDAYKEHFKSFRLTPRIQVSPPWEHERPRLAEHALVLDPGRAFGTGLHATTLLVARWLDQDADRYAGRAVLDVGTGSGILGLVALRLGAGSVTANDNDADAVQTAAENAVLNELKDRFVATAEAVDQIEGPFPYVLANIRPRILIALADAIAEQVAPGGRLILSGILIGERDEVEAVYRAHGFSLVEAPEQDETDASVPTGREGEAYRWVALVMDR
ncbi:MAG: 50S ribosomal protein L11 methyltransferase [Myxococcota bacterium]